MNNQQTTQVMLKVKLVSVDEDVVSVLRASKLVGDNLILPGTLDRVEYEKIAKVLQKIGLKWNKKLKCHQGVAGAADAVKAVIKAGEVIDEKQTYQFFETPPDVAAMMVSAANIMSSHKVLEPSAGKGAIVKAILDKHPDLEAMHVIELNPKMIPELRTIASTFLNNHLVVLEENFVQHNDRYDRIVMNPPFANGQDCAHVRHAYDLLNPGGRLIAIMSRSWMGNNFRKSKEFKEWFTILENQGLACADCLSEGTFKDSGTMIGTLMVSMDKVA